MGQNVYAELCGLTAYRCILRRQPMAALKEFLRHLAGGDAGLDQYAEIFDALYGEGYESLAAYLEDHLRYDESPYAEAAAKGKVPEALAGAAERDIRVLSEAAALDCAALKTALAAQLPEEFRESVKTLPEWQGSAAFTFASLTRFYQINGSGDFARYQAFLWQGGEIHPVSDPDYMLLEDMWGYERQRSQVIENTRALMAGHAVNNVLLYGNSGTGKSATVKSLLGMPEFEGLRLIEVKKDELTEMSRLVRMLGHRPQKFIIFIDDLSFDKEDTTFSCIKSILEGGVEPRPVNVAIYCTSNRRQLIRQNFSDRMGDDMNVNETVQDKTSLADRFGLRILFDELSRPEYFRMIMDIARSKGIKAEESLILQEANKWEIRNPGRCPRSANQFVTSLLTKGVQ